MAILSFAHLLPKKSGDQVQTVHPDKKADKKEDAPIINTIQEKEKEADRPDKNADIIEVTVPVRTTFSIPAVMPTALLVKVRFCNGCPRFISDREAVESKILPVSKGGYGWCLRDQPDGSSKYISIPASAKVERCFYMLDDKEKT